MINQVEKKNPKRRFKEFLGKENWNVHTLGTVLMSMYNGQTPSRSKGEYWNGKINWLTSGELNCGIVNDTFEKITELGLDSAKLKIIPKGILVIAITGLEASGTRGNCAILGCNTTLNQSCMALFPIRSLISSDFLFYWYLFIGDYYGIKYTQGTKQQSYNAKILNDLEILIPSLDEQNKISSFFSKLDSMIDFQKRKLDKLEATKKALLQEIFPEEGQDKPKRRFKGFTGAWEQRKLTYIFNDFIVPMRDKPKVFSGTTPWTRIEDIEGRYINTSLSGRFVSDETIKSMNLKVIPKGSLIVSASATFGVVAIVNNDLITNQTFIGLVPNKDFDIDFLYSLFEAPTTKNKLLKLSAGSTIFYIARESFENLVLSVPSKVEQIKISKIFKSIDNSITLHQRKLDKLKNLKQAYLNEMFV